MMIAFLKIAKLPTLILVNRVSLAIQIVDMATVIYHEFLTDEVVFINEDEYETKVKEKNNG